MSTPELRKTHSRYAAGGINRPSASYFGASEVPTATATAPRIRVAAVAARTASRLGQRRILRLLGNALGDEASGIPLRKYTRPLSDGRKVSKKSPLQLPPRGGTFFVSTVRHA